MPKTTTAPFATELFDSAWIPALDKHGKFVEPPGPLAVREIGGRELISIRNTNRSRRGLGPSRKVMIVLHGRGDSLESFRDIQDELRMPEMNFLLLNAPRAFGDGFSWYPSEPRHKEGVCRVRAILFRLVNELKAAGFRSEDIFWMGHSQGCLIACDLVLNHPDRFGGVVGVSGYLWFFRGWKKKVQESGAFGTPWLITHGTRDRIIRPREIREDISQLIEGAVPVLYREFSKGHDFDFSNEVPFIRKWLRSRHSESARSL